jgi:hypothetical protein
MRLIKIYCAFVDKGDGPELLPTAEKKWWSSMAEQASTGRAVEVYNPRYLQTSEKRPHEARR